MEDGFMDLLYMSDDGLTYGYDTTGDGQVDVLQTAAYDDGVAHLDTFRDTDGDGIFDSLVSEIDGDGDGYFETLAISEDYDQNGIADYVRIYKDIDADGEIEMTAHLHSDETNTNYRVEVDVDYDGDHVSDEHMEDIIPIAGTESSLPFNGMAASYGSADANGNFDPDTPSDQVAGDPATSMEVWECQGATNRCALFSQKFVIEELTGREIDTEEFVGTAIENGWFSEEGGTTGLNMNKMLEYYGIDHEVVYDSDLSDLEDALRNGDKIIVGIDCEQVWYGKDNDLFSPTTTGNHAVEVIGIDYSDPQNPMVVLNDSGTPDGRGEMVPLDVFEGAWDAGDHQMIVCRA